MKKNGNELSNYAKSMLRTPYFYGAKILDGIMTEEFMQRMSKLYPSIVTKNYMLIARNNKQVGRINTDCSGLVAGYRKINVGSAQLYQSAYTRLPIQEIKEFALGTVLWRTGHVGIYIGMEQNEPICIEAKGIRFGTVKTKVSSSSWKYGLTFKDLEYEYKVNIADKATYKGKNPYTTPKELVRYGMRGEVVKWVQWELIESGYKLIIDGIFGNITLDNLIRYQKSCKLVADGIVGPLTRTAFLK